MDGCYMPCRVLPIPKLHSRSTSTFQRERRKRTSSISLTSLFRRLAHRAHRRLPPIITLLAVARLDISRRWGCFLQTVISLGFAATISIFQRSLALLAGTPSPQASFCFPWSFLFADPRWLAGSAISMDHDGTSAPSLCYCSSDQP